MAIEFTCPHCETTIRVPDESGGKKGTCPGCHAKLRVPQVEIPSDPEEPAIPEPTPPFPPAPPVFDDSPAVVSPEQFVPPDSVPVSPPTVVSPPGRVDPALPAVTWPGEESSAPTQGASPVPVPPDFASPPVPDASPQETATSPAEPEAGTDPGRPLDVMTGSVTASVRRRSKRKLSGLWFVVICGGALVGGVAYLYLQMGPKLEGNRTGFQLRGFALRPKTIGRRDIGVSDDVLDTVLAHFEEDPQRLDSHLIETEFRGSPAGLEVRIRPGTGTRFFQFHVDQDLRGWADSHAAELDANRRSVLQKSVREMFEAWDLALRNQTGIEDFASYRDRVGLNACIGGLGAHVSAQVGDQLYPCVYEEDAALYFLLPPSTKKFVIVGRHANGEKSLFLGRYTVTAKIKEKKADEEP